MDAEELEAFMEELYEDVTADSAAKDMLREHLRAQGIDDNGWEDDLG